MAYNGLVHEVFLFMDLKLIQMNKFEKWWYKTGSAIRPLENEDNEEHTKRVCAQFYNDVINKNNLYTLLPAVRSRLVRFPLIRIDKLGFAISGRAILDQNLWHNKNALVRVFGRYFIVYKYDR